MLLCYRQGKKSSLHEDWDQARKENQGFFVLFSAFSGGTWKVICILTWTQRAAAGLIGNEDK